MINGLALMVIFFVSILPLILLFVLIALESTERESKKQKTSEKDPLLVNPATINTKSFKIKANAYNKKLTFHNLVLYSGYNTRYTEIDEVIVSPYGIFCIEYKAHVGYIFGSADQKNWTQCKYNKQREKLYNPLLQNYKHVKSLELLLGNNLKTPIHSIVVFTDASMVKADDPRVLTGKANLNRMLQNHTTQVYAPGECEKICRILAAASSYKEDRLPRHIAELQVYTGTATASS